MGEMSEFMCVSSPLFRTSARFEQKQELPIYKQLNEALKDDKEILDVQGRRVIMDTRGMGGH